MDYSLYKPSDVERWICDVYQENEINYPCDLDIHTVASIFGIEIKYYEGRPFAQWEDNDYAFIFLNSNHSIARQREKFFHELCHPLHHAGKQRLMPCLLKDLQEFQAAKFQMYASMPYYMLLNREELDISSLMEDFMLPEALVKKRIEQMQWKMFDVKLARETNRALRSWCHQ